MLGYATTVADSVACALRTVNATRSTGGATRGNKRGRSLRDLRADPPATFLSPFESNHEPAILAPDIGDSPTAFQLNSITSDFSSNRHGPALQRFQTRLNLSTADYQLLPVSSIERDALRLTGRIMVESDFLRTVFAFPARSKCRIKRSDENKKA